MITDSKGRMWPVCKACPYMPHDEFPFTCHMTDTTFHCTEDRPNGCPRYREKIKAIRKEE